MENDCMYWFASTLYTLLWQRSLDIMKILESDSLSVHTCVQASPCISIDFVTEFDAKVLIM
jgi:hypothetical protein